ncbi:hypothetical protein [Aeromonas sp.]|nr:hypothetical protein [Aeromonas sp.]
MATLLTPFDKQASRSSRYCTARDKVGVTDPVHAGNGGIIR